jgi:hypothetical protein
MASAPPPPVSSVPAAPSAADHAVRSAHHIDDVDPPVTRPRASPADRSCPLHTRARAETAAPLNRWRFARRAGRDGPDRSMAPAASDDMPSSGVCPCAASTFCEANIRILSHMYNVRRGRTRESSEGCPNRVIGRQRIDENERKRTKTVENGAKRRQTDKTQPRLGTESSPQVAGRTSTPVRTRPVISPSGHTPHPPHPVPRQRVADHPIHGYLTRYQIKTKQVLHRGPSRAILEAGETPIFVVHRNVERGLP